MEYSNFVASSLIRFHPLPNRERFARNNLDRTCPWVLLHTKISIEIRNLKNNVPVCEFNLGANQYEKVVIWQIFRN